MKIIYVCITTIILVTVFVLTYTFIKDAVRIHEENKAIGKCISKHISKGVPRSEIGVDYRTTSCYVKQH